jgi:hypothetical protein
MTDIIKCYIVGTSEVVGRGELDGTPVVDAGEVVGRGELDGTPVIGAGEVVGTDELVGAITVVAGVAQEGIVVTAVVGAGLIEDSGQLNGARLFSGAYVFPERSITGE